MSAESSAIVTLETLPKELLLEVCNYLEIKDIKNLSLVNRGFNEVVSTNVSTLRKFHLMLDSDSTLPKGKSELSRSYSQVNLSFLEFSKTTGLWLTSNFCSNLRVLKIMHVDFKMENQRLLRKTFQGLHHLEQLLMSECDMNGYENSMQATVEHTEIKTLKSIHMSATHLAFLLFLRTPNLQSLKISNKSELESTAIITSFLSEQPLEKLEKLALWSIDFEDFEEIEKEQVAQIRIPLKNLSMFYLTAPFQKEETFACFFNLFGISLAELDFRRMQPDPTKIILQSFFKQFHKVKTLRLDLENAPDDADFYNQMPNNPAVTKLIIFTDKSIQRVKAFNGILSKLPNIETLIIKAEIKSSEELQFIATHCTNLKHLAVNKIANPEESLKHVRMPNLEALSICTMKNMTVKSWKDLLRSFKNIQLLSIHKSDEETLNDRTFNIFTKSLSKLKHLTFGDGFQAIKRVFNQMGKNCRNLQTVEMLRSSFKEPGLYERVVKDFRKAGLRFICYSQVGSACDEFDQYYGTAFWKTSSTFDFEDDDEDYDDFSDSEEDSDSDPFDYFDSDNPSEDEISQMLRMIAHGPGGVPWYDSDSGEQQMGRFDSDGEWEPFEAEYYLD